MIHRPACFLTAQWRDLAMLNFAIDPGILADWLPLGTELDTWRGVCYVSLVGFLFQDTRVWGLPIPGHRNFEEVNLRFYVRRRAPDGWRRGVVFVKELVPRRAVTWIANRLYGENYATVRMGHTIDACADEARHVRYWWQHASHDHAVEIETSGPARPAEIDSEPEFITEHYWGYSGGTGRPTVEYEVEHPRWNIWPAAQARFTGDALALYGPAFAEALSAPPTSAFLADGSAVRVYRGTRIG
jgi:uncharacterized protein YqjF (DUF2071 family)